MNSFEAKNLFLQILRGESVPEDAVPRWMPKSCFSCKLDGSEIDPAQFVAQVTDDGLDYELAAGLFLHLKIREFEGFPTVEYTPVLENRGIERSARISDFCSLDFRGTLPEYYKDMLLKDYRRRSGSTMRIRANLGSLCDSTDFFPADRILYTRPGCNTFEMTTDEGRCSAAFMPFFGVDFDDNTGVNIAIGWSGAWRSTAELAVPEYFWAPQFQPDYRVNVSMLKTDFRLEPGEKVTLPSILLQFRVNESIESARNRHRRLMLKEFSPKDSAGNLIKPPVSLCLWGGLEHENALKRVKIVRQNKLPYEALWIDAGWTGTDAPCPHFLEDAPCEHDWWSRIGSWKMNRYAHPDGFAPLFEQAHAAGMKSLVWFEPERVFSRCCGEVLTEHPEWLLHSVSDTSNYVLNLGNPDACKWITDLIGDYLEREKIDHLRTDFNINTLPYWNENDTPDRIGITEIRYVEGLRNFWGAIRKRFPDLFIDNCASGGRRLDYFMAQHSFPLCQSDFATFGTYQYTCVQLENYFLSSWLPLHGTLVWNPDVTDVYSLLSHGGAATGYGDKIWQFNGRELAPDHPMDLHRSRIALMVRLRDIQIRSDYYPLTPDAERLENWCACQFHDPEKDEGYLLAFRRSETIAETETFSLRGICETARYAVEYLDGRTAELSGADLQRMTVSLPPHSVELVMYLRRKRTDKGSA